MAKEIHITFSGNVFGEVKFYLAKQGKKEHEDFEVFELFQYLTYGDISDVPASARQVVSHWYTSIEQVNKTNEAFTSKIKKLSTNVNLKVWVAPKIAEQFINLCYWAGELKDFENIEIIRLDFDNISDSKNHNISDQIVSISGLTRNDLDAYAKLWGKAMHENKSIRYVKDEKIYSADESFFDEQILKQVTGKFKRFGRLYSGAREKIEKTLGIVLSYETFQEIMIRLESEKRVLSKYPVGFEENDYIFIDNSFKIAEN